MSKKVLLTKEKIAKIWEFYEHFSKNSVLQNIYGTPQHRTSNTYRHVCLVAQHAVAHAIRKNLDYDYYSLIRGAFLHDLFYYNWRVDRSVMKHHLTHHPLTALENAQKEFFLSDTEIDIIRNHMWPITITHFPRTKEGRLVMMMDKKVTIIEFFLSKKSTIVFDLDGTLLNTLPDLNAAVNYMCEHHHYETKDIEHTRKAIGNGIKKLVQRSIPEDVTHEDYENALQTFKSYYNEHSLDLTKPYVGAAETLRLLRQYGYRLVVVTNKDQDVANKVVSEFFPHYFSEVIGNNGIFRPKPYPDMVNEARKRLKVRRLSKCVYIGDTEIDYQIARNAHISCVLVSYGYRTRDELIKLKLKAPVIDAPGDLVNLLMKNTKL